MKELVDNITLQNTICNTKDKAGFMAHEGWMKAGEMWFLYMFTHIRLVM